jgi:acetyltransferase-like isoleucine patch superfamily enzyme
MNPRAINPDGSLKAADDWVLTKTLVKRGAALGANSTIRCGVTIGDWALVGSGSVVTQDVPPYGLVYGNPARLHGFVCTCARPVKQESQKVNTVIARCNHCGNTIEIPLSDWEKMK